MMIQSMASVLRAQMSSTAGRSDALSSVTVCMSTSANDSVPSSTATISARLGSGTVRDR